ALEAPCAPSDAQWAWSVAADLGDLDTLRTLEAKFGEALPVTLIDTRAAHLAIRTSSPTESALAAHILPKVSQGGLDGALVGSSGDGGAMNPAWAAELLRRGADPNARAPVSVGGTSTGFTWTPL